MALEIGIVGSMESQLKPSQASADTLEVSALDADDLTQIAKFLDALLEADIANKSNKRKQDNEGFLSYPSGQYPLAV